MRTSKIALGFVLSLPMAWMAPTHAQAPADAPEASQTLPRAILREGHTRWLTPSTCLQLGLVASAFAWDGQTTQARLGYPTQLQPYPGSESNPILSRFHSRPATAGYFAGALVAYGAGTYTLRRHPRWRWALTAGTLGVEAFAIRRNYQWTSWARGHWQGCVIVSGPFACPR